jgi:hypothetical protein
MSSNSPWPPPAPTPASQPEQQAQPPQFAAPQYPAPTYPQAPANGYPQAPANGYPQPYAYGSPPPTNPGVGYPGAYPTTNGVKPAIRGRRLAIASFAASALLVLGLVLAKLLQALLIIPTGIDDENPFVEALGYIGIASIVLILFAIVAGHIAFAWSPRGTGAQRFIALLGFSIGYVMLILYFLRLLATILNLQGAEPSDHLTFPGEFFWWS